jgi:SAM-dependent methyltransferase
MSTDPNLGNRVVPAQANVPTMVTTADIALVRDMAANLSPDDTVIEVGPWLGAFSVLLARHADLHVVDTFIWTKDHAKRLPEVLTPGDSFEPLFKANLAARGLVATVHTTDIAQFVWTGGPIKLCVIDLPKKAEDLRRTLCAIAPGVTADTTILIKNGLNPQFPEMLDYAVSLIDTGALVYAASDAPPDSNVLVLRGVPDADLTAALAVPTTQPATAAPQTMNALGVVQLGGLRRMLEAGHFTDAYARLSDSVPDQSLIRQWQKLEPTMIEDGVDPTALHCFSEIFTTHHSTNVKPAIHFHKSPDMVMRAWWQNNADKPWRGSSFHPEILTRAFDFGYMGWPSKVQELVRGLDVLDVGCGPGLHGLGYLAAGAKSYTGVDPIVKMDADRSKNLTGKRKENFGWTPREMAALIEPWHISAVPTNELPQERMYDIVTLHNVTEHLTFIESIFADIAVRLRPGGQILYNHHNYFAWNGHHQPPKTVAAIDLDDPEQRKFIDWGHVGYDPAPDHYIARGLNRFRLDQMLDLTRKYFDIQVAQEIPSRPETGVDRLTDTIRQRYPHLTDRDFTIQNLLVIGKVRL